MSKWSNDVVCDNCNEFVGSLVYVSFLGQDLCCRCINQLVDLMLMKLPEKEIRELKEKIE